MRMLDLFSGIGGFALAAQWVWGDELEIVSFCEIDPFCQQVLKKHWPDVPCHDDIKTLEIGGKIDLLTGGFPCQDVSLVGERIGLNGERSGLWSEMFRIISTVRPKYVIIENVVGLIQNGLERVVCELASIGYDSEWQVISAKQIGAWHQRERVWIVAYPVREPMHKTGQRWRTESQGGEARLYNRNQSGGVLAGVDWEKTPSEFLRMADGLPSEPHRRKALGNAIVPQVAEVIFRAIKAVD